MRLHKSKQDFIDLIEAAAQHLRLRPVFVEKDYWVTYVLKNLSQSVHRGNVIFKGGTSLSKAYSLIERFSEDIDLAVLSPGEYTDAKMKALLKQIAGDITTGLTLIDGHPSEVKFGKNRTTAYQYPEALDNPDFGVVKDYILVEINCFTNPVPYNEREIQCYAAQYLQQSNRADLIAEYELEPFTINALSLERTYFEKVLSVNRLSYTGKDALMEKVRHFYDIHLLQSSPALKDQILTPAYFDLILAARKDDENNRTMQGEWRNKRLAESPLFSDLENQWNAVAPAYQKDMTDLVWAKTIPKPGEILETLKALRSFLQSFDEKHPPSMAE